MILKVAPLLPAEVTAPAIAAIDPATMETTEIAAAPIIAAAMIITVPTIMAAVIVITVPTIMVPTITAATPVIRVPMMRPQFPSLMRKRPGS